LILESGYTSYSLSPNCLWNIQAGEIIDKYNILTGSTEIRVSIKTAKDLFSGIRVRKLSTKCPKSRADPLFLIK